ncbi:nucleotide sugar dehydrogenase [Knoellia sp. p5-6-4]|uniref:nucleotide sugar dehydrogenase n=1 Tax=unclassified Knoellia TaxID=2618719 RepID=UPI0023DA262C|nr:nucleotide sugar dehydrogenase [Knoellia sp. p5-6-4]MDF2144469.1 nucleotide sugar dehydrogenase [Knoellia sp. p5-6-4]
MSRVTVVGLGYVGLPLAVRAAEVGHEVVGLDSDASRVDMLRGGCSYVEDVSSERLREVTAAGAFRPASGGNDVGSGRSDQSFEMGVIAVPTPLRGREPDLSFVEDAARALGRGLSPGASVVLESTSFPGTTEQLLAEVLAEASGLVPGTDFHLGFSPERIDPGNRVNTFENTPKLVSATTQEGLLTIRAFYDTLVKETVPVSSPRVAEMTKLFENIQANVNIALINEVATLCHELDVDVWEMIDASMTKGHSMAYWTPGPGVGGHCLPVDPLYLAWQSREVTGRPFRFAELADEINGGRPHYVVERVEKLLAEGGRALRGAQVLVVGVAYKANVADLRESPAFGVVRTLQARGAQVSVVDPHVTTWGLTPVVPAAELAERIEEYELVVVVTDHAAVDYDVIGAKARLVLDCRHVVPPRNNVVQL